MRITKDKIVSLLLIIFFLLSFLYISPEIKESTVLLNSFQLKTIVTRTGNTERTDYINDDGIITVAADKKYATILITKGENYKLEEYLDEKGEPTRRYAGEYAVLREYDDHGNNIRNTCLDADGNPVLNTSGYAIEKREYDENGKAVLIRYYDTDEQPVSIPSSGYGKINEYTTDGLLCRTTYINASGDPMMTRRGCASVTFSSYTSKEPGKGKTENEFYFDSDGNPVCLSLGQYGVHKEYDEYGRESVLTYLDTDGNPVVTKKGYTKVVRTYHADNSIATEQYYDVKDKPFSLPEGQYGIKQEGGRTLYLDENGGVKYNLKTTLHNHSRIIIFASMILIACSETINRKWNILLLILYLCAVSYLTLIYRDQEGTRSNFELFWSYRHLFSDGEIRADILKNIWLFVPLGAILHRIWPKWIVLLIPFIISMLIEIIQYFTGMGLCELDDVISNSLGGIIGYETARLLDKLKKIHTKRTGNF